MLSLTDRELAALLLALVLSVFALLDTGCAASHGRIEGPPLYVHLCDAMPEADREAWGSAASAINAELDEPALWVGHGQSRRCGSVNVCLSSEVASVETRIGACVVTVRYAPGHAGEVAVQELERVLEELP